MTEPLPARIRFADLGPRLISGLVLGAVSLAVLWMGGLWLAVLVAVALVLMLWEYGRMVSAGEDSEMLPVFAIAAAGAAAVFATQYSGLAAGLACLVLGVAIAYWLARPRAAWLGGGIGYMGLAMCYVIVLRQAEPSGIWLVFWLVLVVVAADVGAYFAGRAIGGPKLWRKVSPGKTWSGAAGGLAAAVAVGFLSGPMAGLDAGASLLMSLGAGIASQMGDLLESAVKRRFNVKDASQMIPGHGGVMDRLDGVMGGMWFLAVCDVLGLGAAGQ